MWVAKRRVEGGREVADSKEGKRKRREEEEGRQWAVERKRREEGGREATNDKKERERKEENEPSNELRSWKEGRRGAMVVSEIGEKRSGDEERGGRGERGIT